MAAHLLIATNPKRQTTQHRILLVETLESNTCDPHIVRMLQWIWHLTDLCYIDIVFNFQISDINYTSRSRFYQFIVVQVPLWHWATFTSFYTTNQVFSQVLYIMKWKYLCILEGQIVTINGQGIMCVSFVCKWFGFQNLSRDSVLSLLLLKYGTCITAIVTIITTSILVEKKKLYY